MAHGFWKFAHEYRTDFCTTILLVFILYYGGGGFSVDKRVFIRKNQLS
jgi:putative oxidoreductase